MDSITFNALNEEKRLLLKMQTFDFLCAECIEKVQDKINSVQDDIEVGCEMGFVL